MNIISQSHIFSLKDINKIKSFGYSFTNNNGHNLFRLINDKFENFNLATLLEVIENRLILTSTTPVTKTIEFDYSKSWLKIFIQNSFSSEDDALFIERNFYKKSKIIQINHDYCVIPKAYRGAKLIQYFFKESLQQYINIDATSIKVIAGLSGGGYVWARHGFVATRKKDVQIILEKAHSLLSLREYNIVKIIFDGYYSTNPRGRSFPIDLWSELPFMKNVLMQCYWHGKLNLKNKNQLYNFINYVHR